MAFEKYRILELQPDASPDQIKRAYYRLVRLHPPEREAGQFKAIRAAYETLSDPRARQAYDAMEQHGDQVAVLSDEAEKLMRDGRWEDAARRLKHLVVLVPQADDAWNRLGLCQLHSGSFEQAAKTYDALTRRTPDVAIYWANHGAAYHEWAAADGVSAAQRASLLKTARQCYRRAVAIEDGNSTHYLAISRAYADEERYDEASAWAEKGARCTRGGREDFESLFWMCVLHLRRRMLEEVLPLAQRIMAALPENEDAYKYAAHRFAGLGLELHKQGAFQPAAVFYEAARNFDPENDDIRRLYRSAEFLAQAVGELERIKVDALIIPPMRTYAGFCLADVDGDPDGRSSQERKSIGSSIVNAIITHPPRAILASAQRIRDQYPATYKMNPGFYDSLAKAAHEAGQARGRGNSSCFVVTATFGTPDAAQVQACRAFRDAYLVRSGIGLALIALYNRTGPPMARFIDRHPSLRRILAPVLGQLIRCLPSCEHSRHGGLRLHP